MDDRHDAAAGATVSTAHVYVAAEPVFPASSVAFTLNVCEPSARPEYAFGLEQAEKPAPSSSHAKLAPLSLAPKEKLGPVSLEGSEGFAVTLALGGVVSTVHVKIAGVESVLPAASVAFTSNVCWPSARPEYGSGLEQGEKPPPSSSHSKVEPASVAEKPNEAPVAFVGSLGSVPIDVSGAVASTTHVYVTAEPVFPAVSVPLTLNVCAPSASPE